MSQGPLLWFLNRGSGLVLLALLTVVTAMGVWSLRARAGGRVPGFVSQSVHRNLALMSAALLLGHVAAAVADEYVDIRWWQAFVPWRLAYRLTWLALGTVALDLVVVVVVTSLLRDRLGRRAWRAVHLTTYAAWACGLVHGLGIGTDSGEPWARWIYLGSAVVVLAALVFRPRRSSDLGTAQVEVPAR